MILRVSVALLMTIMLQSLTTTVGGANLKGKSVGPPPPVMVGDQKGMPGTGTPIPMTMSSAPAITDDASGAPKMVFVMGHPADEGKDNKDGDGKPDDSKGSDANTSGSSDEKSEETDGDSNGDDGKVDIQKIANDDGKVDIKKLLEVAGADQKNNEKANEEKCPEDKKKSTVSAILLEVFLTPVAERFYLGYHSGAYFAVILGFIFLFCWLFGTYCAGFCFGYLPKVDDQVKIKAVLTTTGMASVVLLVIFLACCALWSLIDLILLITHHMKDANGCELGP